MTLPLSVRCSLPVCYYKAMQSMLEVHPESFDTGANHCEFVPMVLKKHLKRALQDLPRGLVLEFGTAYPDPPPKHLCWTAWQITTQLKRTWEELKRPLQERPKLLAFDSFQGLPRDWKHIPKGTFAAPGGKPPDISTMLPEVADSIEFMPGLFEETVPRFFQELQKSPEPQVALVHIDADLYESALIVLNHLLPFLSHGSLLVLDDVWCGTCRCHVKRNWTDWTGVKEIFEALAEGLLAQRLPWRLEILETPWELHQHDVCQGFRLAARVVT